MQIIYYLSIVLYQYQSLVLSSESKLNIVALICILGISFFYLVKTVATPSIPKAPIIAIIISFIFLFVLYYFIYPNGIDTVKVVIFVLVSFFPVYFWTNTNILSYKKLRYFVVTVLILSMIRYFEGNADDNNIFEISKSANNVSYSFIMLIPLIILLFWEKKKSLILILGLIFVFTILGLKRGAMLCLFGSYLIIIFNLFRGGIKKNSLRNLIVLICILSVISFFVYYMYENNEYIQQRLLATLAGDSSGRDNIYSTIFNSWYESNDLLYKLFGRGINYSISIIDSLAHNDWLELLSSMGILGVILYIILFLNLISIQKKCKCKSHKVSMYVILFSSIVISMFSMLLYSSDTYLFMIVIAIIVAKNAEKSKARLKVG